jgi:histidine ammonia-lyase
VTVTLDGSTPSIDDVVRVARDGEQVRIAASVLDRLEACRRGIDALVDSDAPIYGVSTGFGSLASTYIAPGDRATLQRSLLRSHAAGAGDEVEVEVVRAMMLCRLRTLCSGVTGVRASTAAAYADLLNAGITPVVFEFGSLGCSGDLAPLAHVGLALMGEGEVRDASGTRMPADDALGAAGLMPVRLAEKEGLALINGTDGMLGMLLLAIRDSDELLRIVDVTASVSIQSLRGTDRVFRDDLQRLRPQVGQQLSAANLVRLTADSPIVLDHVHDTSQVQDAYSLRCAPQVHGAARDTIEHARRVANLELAAAIDNPVVLSDGSLASTGNFHGAPLGYVLDFCAIALADVASMAERRTDRLLDPARSFGLPPFLAHRPGVDSGLMIAHYTQASLVSEMKRLAVPASVDSIPTSAMQEDHVSMGWHAARKLRSSIAALRTVLAIELMAASRALSMRSPLAGAPAAEALVRALAAMGLGPGPDRPLAREIAAVEGFLLDGSWWRTIEPHVTQLD